MVWSMKGSRPAEAGLIEWKVFETSFFDRFFPLKLCEAKMQDLINLEQGRMSVQEYSVKFTRLSKYAST